MPRRLLAVNVVLASVSLLCAGFIVKQLTGSRAPAVSRARPPATTPAAPTPNADSPRLPAQAYSVIATRNLFSPTRTEMPGAGLAGGPPINIVKPNLHGVVLRDGAPIAYLEDPLTKRIAGYRIGDQIAGGTVQTISADAVVIARPDGAVDVRLRDPSKPRPPAPPAAGQPPVPGQPPGAGQPPASSPQPTPGVLPPSPRVFMPPPVAQPVQPGSPPAAPPPLPPPSVGPRALMPVQPAVEPPPTPPTPLPPTAPPVPPAQRGRFVVLNFDNADVETVIQAASEIIGFNYVLSPDVRGKVTVQTSGRIAQEEVFGVLLAILEVHGFTAVKAGNLYKILPIEGARERALPTIVRPVPDPNRTTDEIITQIVPIKYSAVADLSALLRPLISTRGTLIAHRETNVLIITDTSSNVTRLLDIIRLVDVQVAQEELQIIPITYADSAELATILTQLFARGRIRSTAPGTPPAPTPVPTPGVPTPPPAGQPSGSAERAPLIIPERRSNSLIVHAKKHEVETIKRLVAQLDVNIYGGRRVFIYYAENAKAKDLAATLNAIYGSRDAGAGQTGPSGAQPPARPGVPVPPPPPPPPPGGPAPTAQGASDVLAEGQVRFIADEVTNAVIVTTFPRSWTEIENTVKQLDRMPRQVLIEVLVAEVTLTDDTRLGIDWAVRSGTLNIANMTTGPGGGLPTSANTTGTPPFSTATLPAAVGGPGALIGPYAAGLTAFTFATDKFIAMLNAMAAENKVNIVSNPHVMTSENKKAVINVSTSVPIVTSQTTGQVAAASTTATTTTTTAGLNKIPVIGSLFGFTEKKIDKTELLLLITPRVIGTALDAARLTEEMRRTTPEIDEAVRKAPRPPKMQLPPVPRQSPPPVTP